MDSAAEYSDLTKIRESLFKLPKQTAPEPGEVAS